MGWLVSLNSKPSVCCYAMGVLGVAGRRFNRFSLTKYANHRRHSCEYIQKRKLSSNFSKNDSILPVLIIGAGPVGLVLSVLLTKLGILSWCTCIELLFLLHILVDVYVIRKAFDLRKYSLHLLSLSMVLIIVCQKMETTCLICTKIFEVQALIF